MACLNAADPSRAPLVFRAWPARLEPLSPPLRSCEGDPELLLHIPLDGAIKLKALCVIGGGDGSAPARMRAFINRDDLDFEAAASLPPTQEWDLQEANTGGVIEYPTQPARFGGVHALTLHLVGSFGGDCLEVHFIGLKGEYTERRREAVAATYEARPMPADHRVAGGATGVRLGI